MSLRWRLGSVAALVLLLGYLALANFFAEERRAQAWYLPDEGLRLGLDLQGGIHLVISPDLEAAVAQELGHIEDGLVEQLEEKKITGVRTCCPGSARILPLRFGREAVPIGRLVPNYTVL